MMAHVPIQMEWQPLLCFTKQHVALIAQPATKEVEARALPVSWAETGLQIPLLANVRNYMYSHNLLLKGGTFV